MDRYLDTLRSYWGYDHFRGIQREIIESIGAGYDTLGLMPTGGGKSITFQVPALTMEGLCLVVTPLIALMKDQVGRLRSMDIKATSIHSGMSRQEIIVALENCIFGDYKFLYISPERLKSELFLAKLRHMNISFITIDEAHCISQWGYDFRPSYLEIATIRELLPDKAVLALTATATGRVIGDIQEKLKFQNGRVFRMSFDRPNLTYKVIYADDKSTRLKHILQEREGSAIIYTRNRKETRDTAERLTEEGIPALHYHAGLENTSKDLRQKMWQQGDVRAIVATNAFGMGIDKADVRTVVHLDPPDSPEAYFQEAGRAGRDGQPAEAILLFNGHDAATLRRRIHDAFPEKDYIRRVYEDLGNFYQLAVGDGYDVTYEMNMEKFCHTFHYFPVPVLSALKILTRAGYIDYRDEDDNASRLMFLLNKSELYRLQHLSRQADQILQSILRTYGGVFSDYATIEEAELARQTGLSQESIYELLKGMNQQRIIHYIPRKRIPHITYLTRREMTDRIVLGPEVYEQRKKEYASRIEAMLHYATSATDCRSRMLLDYFEEKDAQDCGRCDYCTSHQTHVTRTRKETRAKDIATALLTMLADGEPHPVSQLASLPYDENSIGAVVRMLIEEEEIGLEDGCLHKN